MGVSMLRAILVSPDRVLAGQLAAAVAETKQVGVARALDRYPADHELPRIVRAHAPQIFFLDVGSLADALRLAAAIQEAAPGTQVLAFDRACDPRTLLDLMRAGIREFIAVPDSLAELGKALDRVAGALERTPPSIPVTDEVIAFLPAKPGVGCSTVALNASVALAAQPGTRVLLADFDLNCGIVAFLLHLDAERSLVDAAEHAPQLDEELWPKLVSKVRGLDVLPAGPMRPGFRIELPALRYLLDFARRNYDAICADLSGLMERYSVELMQEAKRIFLVCTPELPALHLARQKLEYLRSLELESRVALVLNRAQKRALVSSADIEKLIGLPVAMEIPNDYRGVHRALQEAKPVDAGSEMGKRFSELAQHILSKAPDAKPARRFVEYFSISPARYSFARGKAE
jgi:pilus assembly protein CpaE